MRRLKLLPILLLALATVGPLFAYTIYLKDGSTLIAREKFRVEEGKAIITLQNGTQTFIDASEIDVPRTERVNQGNYGTAFFIDEEGQVVEAPVSPVEQRQRLADVASRAEPTVSTRSPATRPETGPSTEANYHRTYTGFIDLTVFPRTPYRDLDIAVETSRFLRALGVNDFKVFQGTAGQRAFLEMTTNSEASVFRSLEAAADTLIHLRNQFPDQVQEFEVLLTTSNRDRAGQFLIDAETARQLADTGVDTAAFFIQNVQF